MNNRMARIIVAWILMATAVLLAACGRVIGLLLADPDAAFKLTCGTSWEPSGERDDPNTRNEGGPRQPTDPAVLLANSPPNANAGDNIGAVPGQVVVLDGSASDDNETTALKHAWQQISGPRVALSDATVAEPSFTVPSLFTRDATLTFRLTVIDEVGGIDRDTMRVHVAVSLAPSRKGGRTSHILRHDHTRLPDYADYDGEYTDYDGEVTDPFISADGRLVLARSVRDQTVRIWDADTGELRHVLNHEYPVQEAIPSADGRVVLTRVFTAARLWDTASGELLHSWIISTPGIRFNDVNDVALSADGHIALTNSPNESVGLRLWDTATGEWLHVMEGDFHQGASHVTLSADGKRALTHREEGVLFWDVATGTELRRLPGGSYMLSADGSLAMSGHADGRDLKIIDTATGNELCALHGDAGIFEQALLSADGRTVLTGGQNGTVQFYDVASCGEPHVLGQHRGAIHAMALSDDGINALTAGEDGTARLWSTETGGEMQVLRGHKGTVHGVALSADGRLVVTTGADKTTRLWNAQTGEQLRVLDNGHGRDTIESVALSSAGHRAFTGGGELAAHHWDADTGSWLRVETLISGPSYRYLPAIPVALSADGGRGLTGGTRHAPDLGYLGFYVWNLSTGEQGELGGYPDSGSMALSAPGTKALLGGDDGRARLAAVSSDDLLRCFNGDYDVPVTAVALGAWGSLALMGSADGKVRLWNADNGELLHEWQAHETKISSMALSADGRFVLTTGGHDQLARLWDAETGDALHALAHASSVMDVALSADGSLALTADANGTAWLWDWNAPKGEQLYALRGHEKLITSVALSTDATTALTGSRDGTARLWEITTGK